MLQSAFAKLVLLHDNLAGHAGALVRLAVVGVRARSRELGCHALAGCVQVVLVVEGLCVDTRLQSLAPKRSEKA